mgnify:CR=1 FL=1
MLRSLPASPSASRKVRVLCVDDNRDLVAALERCIQREPDMQYVGALHTADDLVTQVKERRPDVILLDLSMPGNDPIAVLRELVAPEGQPDLRVIVFSGRDDPEVVDLAAAAGASGFLSKDANVDLILRAIRETCAGKRADLPFGLWH